MKTLNTALSQVLKNVPSMLASPLIQKKLHERGMFVSAEEAQVIAQRIMDGEVPPSLKDIEPPISITDEDMQELEERFTSFIATDFPQIINDLQREAIPRVFARLKETWPAERRIQAKERAAFRFRLKRRWGRPIGALRMLLTMARDLGASVNNKARLQSDPGKTKLVDVTTRLHARSCQVAEEVITLLEAGFPDGAMARWRTLHEITVTAHFLSLHGQDAALRYHDHQFVESYKGGVEYASLQERLKYREIPPGELEKVQKAYKAVVTKYGHSFSGPYGWAAEALKIPRPTFKDIEAAAGIGHLRSHYRMASHGVHANPKGILFSMAQPPATLLLTGPSNAGLTDPGHATAISLSAISACLVLLSPDLDHHVTLLSMKALSEEIGNDLLAAAKRLEEDERRHQMESTVIL